MSDKYNLSEEDFLAAIHISINEIDKDSFLLVKKSIDTIISKINEKNECQYENKYAYNLDTHSRIFSRIEESIPILLEIKAVLGGVNET